MERICIRHAEPSDYRPVISVVNEWWGGRNMADMLPKLFFVHFRPTSFVAEQDGELVGFVTGFVSQTFSHEAYIHFVGIHPEFRQKGLGCALYRRFFEAVKELGCEVVRCVTSPVNRGSVAFHLRMGFSMDPNENTIDGIFVAEDYDGPGEDRVLFSKALGV
jgi:ribosomal protein S18 acetylase RimI-like enzyme